LTLRQVHSGQSHKAVGFCDREREGDALLTDEIARPIGVRTADCMPILLLDPRRRAVAAVHAGWRGTAAEIVKETIAKLGAEYGCQPADLQAAIGPCIRECCYEVSSEVASRFPAPARREVLGARPHLDLAAANKMQMLACGLNADHIFDCELCTYCDPELFYSYRREPNNPGRMLSFIARLA
jgi:YfiH family protein